MASDRQSSASLSSAAVFEKYRERIYRYILRMTRDHSEAEDLTQETFLRAHRSLETLEDDKSLTAWLYRIATHVCYDRFRQSSYHSPPQSIHAPSPGGYDVEVEDRAAPRLDEAVEQSEMSACVQEYLVNLPDDYRIAIILHDLHGLTNPQIAEMLGCSLDTVKIRVHRARRRLQAALTAGCSFSYDERGVFVCERKDNADDKGSCGQ
jgi:RNA polymerase sigma-70 factor (ECF subfamily)